MFEFGPKFLWPSVTAYSSVVHIMVLGATTECVAFFVDVVHANRTVQFVASWSGMLHIIACPAVG
jgi:hypothetical protein